MIDTVSTAHRLALRGSSSKTPNKFAAAISGGVAAKLSDTLMAALNNCVEVLSGEDVIAIFELYEAT